MSATAISPVSHARWLLGEGKEQRTQVPGRVLPQLGARRGPATSVPCQPRSTRGRGRRDAPPSPTLIHQHDPVVRGVVVAPVGFLAAAAWAAVAGGAKRECRI